MPVLREQISDQDVEHFKYINIDVEGMDLVIVNQIDWDWLKPTLITVEVTARTIPELIDDPITITLQNAGYTLENFICPTAFFRKR